MGGGGGGGKSGNHAWDEIKDTYYPMAQKGVGGYNALGNLLGLGGSGAHSQAINDYWNSTGGKFQLEQGLDAVTSKMSAAGLRQSGAYGKAMEQYRQGLASTYADNFLGKLLQYSQLGLGAGNLMANAGQYSKGQGAGGGLGGILGGVGGLLSGIGALSSRRAKDGIVVLGPWDDRGDGLEKVEFHYRSDPTKTRYVGVIAEDVERLRPWAFIPNFIGDLPGVNYAKLSEAA